jgi:hypothetical protein
MIRRGSSRFVCALPVFPFWWFSEPFLGFSLRKFWGRFFEGFLLDVTYEDLVPFCLVILIQQTLRSGFNMVVFGGVLGKVLFRVDFRFLLIKWVLGIVLLAKGSPRGTPAISKVSPESVERIGHRSRWWLGFSRGLSSSRLTGLGNRSDRFSPSGLSWGFFSWRVLVLLWLFLLKGGEILEVFSGRFGLEGLLAIS